MESVGRKCKQIDTIGTLFSGTLAAAGECSRSPKGTNTEHIYGGGEGSRVTYFLA